MLDPIGAKAIQSLGIDVANLTSRLAVNTAVIDEIVGQASDIDPEAWQKQNPVNDNTGHPVGGYTVTLDGRDAEKVLALLAFIAALQ